MTLGELPKVDSERSIGIVWPERYSQEDLDEVRRFIPDGTTLHMVGTGPETGSQDDITLERVLSLAAGSNIEDSARQLVPLGVSAVAYACTSASYARGVGGDTEISRRMADATGLPATTTTSAAVEALRHLGVTRVAVLSPHVDLLNMRLETFLEDSGFPVARMVGLNRRGEIDQISPQSISEIVESDVDRPDADGVFISCTSMRTASVVDALEQAIGKPVVTANQATAWQVLCLAGAARPMSGLGRLMEA